MNALPTIGLLLVSNLFMTYAWYGHLKRDSMPLWQAVLISWGIAFFEYVFMIPANRMGFANGLSGFQLKMIQEAITLVVFSGFAIWFLGESFHWRYLVAFLLLMGAVALVFWK